MNLVLRIQRTQVNLLANTMTSAMSINTLPVEIIITLFRLLVPKNLATLLLVCRMWRDVLYSMSDLWTYIRVGKRRTMPLLDAISMVSEQASRTGTLPLIVSWYLALEEAEMTDIIKERLTEFFKNAPTSRWEHLSLLTSVGIIEEVFDVGFPALETLTMPAGLDEYSPPVLKALDQTATSIKFLMILQDFKRFQSHLPGILGRVKGIELLDDEFDFSLPENITRLKTTALPGNLSGLQHITHLVLEEVGLPEVEDNQLPALEYLEVTAEPFYGESTTTLDLPNLLHLKIPVNAPFLLAGIVAPKLHHLQLQISRLSFEDEDEEDGQLELDEDEITDRYFDLMDAGRFPGSIQTLIIADAINTSVISEMLKHAPKLRKFDMVAQAFLEAAFVIRPFIPMPVGGTLPETPEEADWSLCSDLRFFTVRYQGTAEDKAMLRFLCRGLIEFRSAIGLKKVKIIWADGTSDFLGVEEVTEGDGGKKQMAIVASYPELNSS